MKICIIGAGLSGLVTIKELKEEGHEVVCYEQGPSTGGVFRPNDDKNPAYDEMSLTVSNYFMAFSSLPPAEPERRYWTKAEYHAYLQRFASTFDLLPHITFQAKVERVEPQADGRWLVHTTINGQPETAFFDTVAVCSGQFQTPFIPKLKGMERFGGTVLHTLDYRNATAFQGKRVVCVGLGESAADVCHQVAQVAQATTLVVRRPLVILPRNWKHFMGPDGTVDATTCLMTDQVFSETRAMAAEAYKFIDPFSPPDHDESQLIYAWQALTNHAFGQVPVKNDIFVRDILDDKLGYNLFGIEEVGPDYVICGDGQKLEADVIIFNTGYENDFSLFHNIPEIKAISGNLRKLYKHMLHPQLGHRLAFIGFVRPETGGVPVCAELQARYLALLCSSKRHLPDADALAQLTEAEAQWENESYFVNPDATRMIRYRAYTYGLADLIGCRPRVPFENPAMLMRYLFGMEAGNWFRLRGPGSQPAAAKAVIKHLGVYFPLLIRLGLTVTVVAMKVAPLVDKLTFGRLGRMLASRRPKPFDLLKQELKLKTLPVDVTVRSLCANGRAWHHLKYKLHKVYQLDPKALHEELTVAQLIDRCADAQPQPATRQALNPLVGQQITDHA